MYIKDHPRTHISAASPVKKRYSKASSHFMRYILAGATGLLFLFLVSATGQAQEKSEDLRVSPSESDSFAASQAQNARHHARPANTPAGREARRSELSNMHSSHPAEAPAAPAPAADPAPAVTRYPGDLQNNGGPVVPSMQSYLVYVNLGRRASCSTVTSCWGNPQAFLQDLGQSTFIHVVDQYVGATDSNRYTVSTSGVRVTYPMRDRPLTDNDMLTIVHAVANFLPGTPSGYGNEYHIFLVPGQDECFDSTFTQCYSPDNPNSWIFCAYHGSADFRDIGHVLYSVEPFQNVAGCSSRPGTPNGQIADSTNNVLSHELFETITDPDGTAWWNTLNNSLYMQEIGDECSFVLTTPTAGYFDPADVNLNGNDYVAQPEYNNAAHACTTAP